MRQAYDYWQNQPGTYRLRPDPAPKVLGTGRPAPRTGELGSFTGWDEGPQPHARPGRPPGAEAPARPPRAIQLPPLSSPRDGPPQTWGFATPEPAHPATCTPQSGGYQPPVTPGGGYGLRSTPECLPDNGGHRPTIHGLRRSPTRRSEGVFGPSPSGPQGGLPGGKRCPGATEGGGDAPPEPEPAVARRRTRCWKQCNSAHGWRSRNYGT